MNRLPCRVRDREVRHPDLVARAMPTRLRATWRMRRERIAKERQLEAEVPALPPSRDCP